MRCSSCGSANRDGARFCQDCGVPLAGPALAPATTAAQWPELKQATVLFVDLVSSTEMVARLDPEDAMERLRPAIAAMCTEVRRFDGTVVRTLGDGIMAVFGAPRAHEGHAVLACEAALAIRRAFGSASRSGLDVRIGLHSGEMVSDASRGEPNAEHGLHGLTLHLASRVPPVAAPGTVAMTEETYRLARAYVLARSLGMYVLKGIPEAVELYELERMKPDVATSGFRSVHSTTLRGRDRELAQLRAALAYSEEGHASVLGVVGAAGMGKSRLCHEFSSWCRGRLIPVFEARAQLYGHATPLQPVLEFLRSFFFGIAAGDDPDHARSRVAERLLAVAPTFAADLPLLYEFLGLASGDTVSLAPRSRHSRLLDIVRHLVRHSGQQASVILIEDLHWLDEASDDFIATLVEAVGGTRTLLVVNYRPSYSAPWMGTCAYFHQIVLGELTTAQTTDLVRELLGGNPALAMLCARVAERSAGNPFFAEELVRSLAESGALVGASGNYGEGAATRSAALPATVQSVIAARIDRLGEDEKRLLQIATVIGKDIPLDILDRVASSEVKNVDAALESLCAAGLLEPHASGHGTQYVIRHPLIQEVAYGAQLKSRRQPLHAAVAKAIERLHRDRLDELAGLLAYHYESAGETGVAARHAARAARWVGSTQPAQAIKHWTHVRDLLTDEPRSLEADRLRIMAAAQISWLGWREGMTAEQARPYIEEALRFAREGDDSMVPLLLIAQGRILVASGGSADAYVERVNEALAVVPAGDEGRLATVYASLSHAYGWAGLLREALVANDASIVRLHAIAPFDNQFLGYSVEHWTHSLRGRILARLGLVAEARDCLDRMLALEAALVDPTVQFIAHLGYVDIAAFLGDSALASQHAARVNAIASRHASPYLRVFASLCEGVSKKLAGDVDGAAAAYREGLECLRATSAAMENEPDFLAALAECELAQGRVDAALALCAEALERAQARSARLAECRAWIALCAARDAQRAGCVEAREAFVRARELVAATGAAIYEPALARLNPAARPEAFEREA